MGVLIDEINELKQMIANFDEGKLSAEDFNTKINGYAQIYNRERLLLTAWALSIKSGQDVKGIGKKLLSGSEFKNPKKLSSRTAKRGT